MFYLIVCDFIFIIVVMQLTIAKTISLISFDSSIPRLQWDALEERFSVLELDLGKVRTSS